MSIDYLNSDEVESVVYALEQELRPILRGQKDSSPMVLVLAFLVLDLLSEKEHVDIDTILEELETDMPLVHTVEFSKAINTLLELRVLRDVDGKRLALHNQGQAAAFRKLKDEKVLINTRSQAKERLQKEATGQVVPQSQR